MQLNLQNPITPLVIKMGAGDGGQEDAISVMSQNLVLGERTRYRNQDHKRGGAEAETLVIDKTAGPDEEDGRVAGSSD